MGKLTDTIAELPATHKAISVLVSTLLAGTFLGASIMGLSAIPRIARENTKENIRQSLVLDSLRSKDKLIEDRIERLTCLMTAQFEGTNPIRCNR